MKIALVVTQIIAALMWMLVVLDMNSAGDKSGIVAYLLSFPAMAMTLLSLIITIFICICGGK